MFCTYSASSLEPTTALITEKKVNTASDSVYEVSIIQTKEGFFPSKIILNSNVKIKLMVANLSTKESSFVVDEYNIYKALQNNKVTSIEFITTKQGAFKFFCPITNKKGWLIVK
jgi:plastocyanin domain-containing protein